MAKFASAAKQAASVMKRLQGDVIKSVGTVRNYEQRLIIACKWVKENRCGTLRDMTPQRALKYLEHRALTVSQKTLDMDRQALQKMMIEVTKRLQPSQKLPMVKSIAPAKVKDKTTPNHGQRLSEQSRAYSAAQVELIASHQAPHNALATKIAHAAGLRAHELLTLQRIHRRAPSERPAHPDKFHKLRAESIGYTVQGKGGLIREVRIPVELAQQLERTKLAEPRLVKDRNVLYKQYYGIGGGHPWSASFGKISQQWLGWSNGAHGVRHSYAQERMDAAQCKLTRSEALRVVSQEMGHFRPDITEVYLR